MKLYKNTLVVSIILFVFLVALSVIFELTYISESKIASFLEDYLIGIACSIIVVVITTLLQFKYEQKKALNSLISEIQLFFFHCWVAAMASTSPEEVPGTLWKHHCDDIYDGLRKISLGISGIEWFTKSKKKKTVALQRAVLGLRMETIEFSNDQDMVLNAINNTLLDEIKENVIFLAGSDDYRIKEITHNYEKIKQELENLEVTQ